MVLDQIEVFQSQLHQTRKEMDERKIDVDDLLDLQIQENLKAKIEVEELSPINFESLEKTQKRSLFFSASQKIQIYSKKIFKRELTLQEQTPLLDIFLGENILINNYQSNTLMIHLFLKFKIEEEKYQKGIIYCTEKKEFEKVKNIQKQIGIEGLLEVTSLEEIQYNKQNLIIFDECEFKLEHLITLQKIYQSKPQFILTFCQSTPFIELTTNILKIQKQKIFTNKQIFSLQNKDNCISFSYEEDSLRTLTKFIKQKVEEEKGIKFNFTKSTQVKFCIVTDDKEEKNQLINYFQNHGIKTAFNFKNSQGADCVLVENLMEIEEDPKNLFILNTQLTINSLCYLLSQFSTLIHIFINQKQFKKKRLEKLQDLANAFVFKDITENFAFDKSQGYQAIFNLDSYDKKINLYSYEKFISYLFAFDYLNIKKVIEKKRVNFFYVKNFSDLQSHIMGNNDLKVMGELTERKNFLILELEEYRKIEPYLIQLKKQAILNYTVFQYKEIHFQSNKKNFQRLQADFNHIIAGYNDSVMREIQKDDVFFAELKNLSFGYFSRSHKNDQDVKEKLIARIENIFEGKNGLLKFNSEDWKKILPFIQNYKKQDLIKDFQKVYEESVSYINKKTFGLTNLKQDDIFRTINMEILKQIFLDVKWKFKIQSSLTSKCENFDFLNILQLLNESIDVLKKI